MSSAEPCNICGCAETNLVDGFYYCAECGTQDTNIRETLVEFTELAEGGFGLANRKRITQIPKTTEVLMSEEWYKWHTLNYLLYGFADQIIAAGAKPSFKTKLLWVWTRYMDKYQDKADFGLTLTEKIQGEAQKPTHKEKTHSDDDFDLI